MTGVCVIVEPRKHPALALSLRFTRATIPDWPIVVFHGTENEEFAKEAAAGLSDISFRPLDCKNLTIPKYNQLLTLPSFYEQFREVEFILIFQTDSLIFPYSAYSIEDFLDYDYFGAPWSHFPDLLGGNGGLSLRRISAMIAILKQHPYRKQTKPRPPEDLFISTLPGLHLPPRHIAERFSTESILHPCPFGVHKPWLTLSAADWEDLVRYAPVVRELRLLNGA